MRGLICVCVALLFACSDNSTGSTTFRPDDLTVLGNPAIVGEDATEGTNPAGFLRVSGTFDSQSGLALTGLKVSVRVLDVNGVAIGTISATCSPETIAPLGSCTFVAVVSLAGNAYTDSRTVEITPVSDQGNGTVRVIAVNWQTPG